MTKCTKKQTNNFKLFNLKGTFGNGIESLVIRK